MSLLAFPGSSAANPPVVPACNIPNTTGSDSCATLRVDAFTPPIGGAFENVGLGFRVRSQFDPATSEITLLQLRFDDDIALDLAGIPSCPASELTGKNIAEAYEQCGPNADGNPPSEGNAYLSTGLGPNVSGIWSLLPANGGGVVCGMMFKGEDNNHVTIYGRLPVASPDSCDDPANNNAGSATVLWTADLSRLPVSSPYDWTLTWSALQTMNPALDDFYATLRRGDAFRARCPVGTSPLGMVGVWDYTATGDANDIFVATDPCP